MKAKIFKGLLLIFLGSSCTPDLQDDSLLEDSDADISSILQRSVSPDQNSSLPIVTTFYQGINVTGYLHHFYDVEGKPLLEIGFNPQNDTTGFATFQFTDQGSLDTKTEYHFRDVDHPVTEFKYHYDNDGKLSQVIRDGSNYESYEYNSLGHIARITLGPPPHQEQYIFEYDENGRISRQVYTTKPQSDPPLRDWYFQYDQDNLLVAKSLQVSETEKKPMYEYRYDSQKRLVKEIEYYPEYNFTLWIWKTLEYEPIKGF